MAYRNLASAPTRKIRASILGILCVLLPLAAQIANPNPSLPVQTETQPTTDAREIMSRSVIADQKNYALAQQYTWEERMDLKHLDKRGKLKKEELKTFDTTFLYGEPYSRVVKIDDKPLDEKEERKEEEKQQKFVDKYKGENEEERRKRLAKDEKEREEQRAFLRDVVNAYDFHLLGEERLEGRDAYVIQLTRRKDFHPTQPHADVLTKAEGKLWIDKASYHWLKLEAETVDTLSFGLFLARVHKGSRISVQWARVNDEVWLPRRLFIDASARVMVFDNEAFLQESEYSNFKKFTSETKVLPGVQEVVPAPTARP